MSFTCNGQYCRHVMNLSTMCKFEGSPCRPVYVQLWQKRVALLRPIRSSRLQTQVLFGVDPHKKVIMSVHFDSGCSAIDFSNITIKFSKALKRLTQAINKYKICANYD